MRVGWLLEVDLVLGVEGKMGSKVGGWEMWLRVRGKMVFGGRRKKWLLLLLLMLLLLLWAEEKVDLLSDETGLVGEVQP